MGLMSDAMSFASSELAVAGGEEVQYKHNGVSTPVIAVPTNGQSQETPTGGRMVLTARSLDFLIAKSLLATEPVRGDEITRANGSKYKVFAAQGGPCWRWSDPGENYYRIQTIKASG